jgi:hypothetical protein
MGPRTCLCVEVGDSPHVNDSLGWELCGSQGGVSEDPRLRGCYAVSLDGQYPTLPEILVPSCSGHAVQEENMVEIPFRITDLHNIFNCEEPVHCHFLST